MRKNVIVATAFLIGINTFAQKFDVDTLVFNGNPDKHINIVILSDGYTSNELSKFTTDATNFILEFFYVIPYSNYRNYFNVFIIKVPSNESGASHPGTATDVSEPVHPIITVDNYFGSTFDSYNIHRLLVATKTAAVSNVLASNFPNYDQVLILVNSPYYGGSGGYYTVASTSSLSAQVAIHEIGHSFGGLKDEYWAGDVYAEEGINMTKETNPSLVRWKNWMGINDIGIYQHCCGGTSSLWYKPHKNCAMQNLGVPFCSVCVQGIIEKIHSLVASVESYNPLENNIIGSLYPLEFKLNLIAPAPNTLKRNWILNNSSLKQNVDSILIDESNLLLGLNTLKVTIEDTTQLLRVDNHSSIHKSFVSWSINDTSTGINKLSVTPLNRDFGSEAGNTTFSISSNTSWTVSDDADWLAVSPSSGSGNGTLAATFTANGLSTARVGTITISATGVSSQVVTITQSGIIALSVTPTNRDVGSEAGNTTFSIISNTSWTVSDDADWLTVSPADGSSNGSITATFAANTLTTPRVGTITISGTEVSPHLITVTQSEPTLVTTLDNLKAFIYPNPTKGNLIIKFEGIPTSNISISVIDEFGKSYYLNEFKPVNFEMEKIIDLTSLKSGLYFVMIKSKSITKIYKIVKN